MIRGTIETASSNSKVWDKKNDFFYSVDGIGGGVWGLRSMQKHNSMESGSASDDDKSTKLDAVQLGGIVEPVSNDATSNERLPVNLFSRITAEHIWNAIQKLMGGFSDHGFGESRDFDLITDEGARLPPKAVFGIAATEALGFKVLPKHFSAGQGTSCFRILTSAGYAILPKFIQSARCSAGGLGQVESKYWVEGKKKLLTHTYRERKPGLANAKKAQFRRLYGKLQCERCELDPVAVYGGVHGEASIEVHHKKIQVQNMDEGHQSKLEDLECLCANCHRVAHRLLKLEDAE